jgi:hypothetical protein
MGVLKDIPIDIEAAEVVRALSRGRRGASWMADEAAEALERALPLIAPVVVYDWLEVEEVAGQRVRLRQAAGRSAELRVGPNAHLMAPARRALVSVNSIGDGLDQAVRELNRKGDPLLAYLLDCVGVVALGKAADAAARMAEDEARAVGWGVGARLGPGSLVGWPTERQVEICRLLPLEANGIRLNESGLILPFKSASGMIGIGPGYEGRTVGSVCRLCNLKESCWRRKPEATD